MISRRHFVQTALATTLVSSLPSFARADGLVTRPSWGTFKNGPNFQSFVDAIKTMRDNTNSNDINSWVYWANIHENHCPHGIPYFLAWHRGYVYLFEMQLKKVAKNSALQLPYWDYYTDPNMPEDFTNNEYPSLYVDNRRSTNVRNALTLDPFQDAIKNFQRGRVNAFEPSVESKPHNPVHNLIGGWMPTMQSPRDPIFWLHHGNIDRLWVAWVNADNGRQMPPSTDGYWNGSFDYGPSGTLPRKVTISTFGLGYNYENESMPNQLPPTPAPARPRVSRLKAMPPQLSGANVTELGGGDELSLDQNSITVEIPVAKKEQPRVQSLIANQLNAKNMYTSVSVVLDRLSLTGAGASGGYYYNVYLDLPEKPSAQLDGDAYLLGTLGPFEIAASEHHAKAALGAGNAIQLVFPATAILQHIAPHDINKLYVSFVRVDGDSPVNGIVIKVGEVRVEASNVLPQ